MAYQECIVWIELVDRYGSVAAEFSRALQASARDPSAEKLAACESARTSMQDAWQQLEQHMHQHRCQTLFAGAAQAPPPDDVLEQAAAAAPDMILIADDDRRFVEVNQAAADLLGVPRDQLIGKRIDDFFLEASGKSVAEAWKDFVARGAQSGICHLASDARRRFAYRAKANFLPGLHLSVLREDD